MVPNRWRQRQQNQVRREALVIIVVATLTVFTTMFVMSQTWFTTHRQLELVSRYTHNLEWITLPTSTATEIADEATEADTSNDPVNQTIGTHSRKNTEPLKPQLSELTGDKEENITGNVQFLLDFAIIGHAKCGTTTFLKWMKDHAAEALVLGDESYELRRGLPARLVHRLYNLQPSVATTSKKTNDSFTSVHNHDRTTLTFRRGYKSPSEIQDQRSLRYIRTYFPKTKLIVGIRHPVFWFESLYNFRIQNIKLLNKYLNQSLMLLPHPNRLIGACQRNMKHTCTDSGLFHVHLARLGKTNLTDDELNDNSSLGPYRTWILDKEGRRPARMPNPIFLYEVTQLQDELHAKDDSSPGSQAQLQKHRSQKFRQEVQAFLGFHHELPPIPHASPGRQWENPAMQAYRDSQKIRICEAEYLPVRMHLLKQAQEASLWIRQYFLNSADVFVSSRDYFEELLKRWMHDPCLNATTTTLHHSTM